MSKPLFVAAIVAAAIAGPAMAATPNFPLSPLTYDEPAPNDGTYTYRDDSYTGTSQDGRLVGGLGDLTDGVIASQHWYETPGVMVGFRYTDPTINFHFASGTTFSSATLYFDDALGAGGVSLPASVTAIINGTTYTGTGVGVAGSAAYGYSFSFGGAVGADVGFTVISGNEWIMLSEATFTGLAAPVPEPGEWAMIVAGLGVVGAVARRRRKG